jgi:hypothetical protein
MKTKLFLMMIAAVASTFAGCKSDDDPAPDPVIEPSLSVSPESISAAAAAGSYSIAVTSNTTWTATVNAAATWCTVSPATGTANGAVTVNVVENATVENRTATATLTAGALTREVSVAQAGIPTPPTHAASTQTWTFGDQTWSDAIHIPDCNKTDFTDSNTNPDCRNYTRDGNTWYYYNWSYVDANTTTLCPSPWRIPSQSDFDTFVNNTTRSDLVSAWGYGGAAYGGVVANTTFVAYYWSSTASDSDKAYSFSYNSENLGVHSNNRLYGFQVRCVK